MFVTAKYHNRIVEQLQIQIQAQKSLVKKAEDLKEVIEPITELLTKINPNAYLTSGEAMCGASWMTGADTMAHLDNTVAVYVDDHLGGKVIKQEATPVTILDKEGKATYAVTAKKAVKGNYILITE